MNTLTFRQRRKDKSEYTSSDREDREEQRGHRKQRSDGDPTTQKAHLGLGVRKGYMGRIWGRVGGSEVLNNENRIQFPTRHNFRNTEIETFTSIF